MTDVFQSVDDLDPDTIQRIVDRLEFRGTYAPFVRMRETYLDRIDLPGDARVVDLGCGTGVVARALAMRPGFRGEIVGIDPSTALVADAERRAAQEGLSNVRFYSQPSGAADEPDGSCDAVIAHTVLSHAADPQAVLAEAGRLLKPGGCAVLFDGDYASMVCHTGDGRTDDRVVRAVLAAVVGNPTVMRELPQRLPDAGLYPDQALGEVLLEVGTASFYASLLESYVPMAVKADELGQAAGDAWLDRFHRTSDAGRFFGACNYVTYIAKPA